jgi:hypothetical protein
MEPARKLLDQFTVFGLGVFGGQAEEVHQVTVF